MMSCIQTPVRDLLGYLGLPVLVTLVTVTAFHSHPWPVPVAAQAAMFSWFIVAPVLILGGLGVALSSRVGFPSAPAISDGVAWLRLALWTVVPGLAVGAAFLLQDATLHLIEGATRASGVTWINVALPSSIGHYTAAAVMLESIYRIIPISILTWVLSSAILRNRWQAQVFWILALSTSMIEPASQSVLFAPNPASVGLVLATFGINLFEADGFRRFGWPAPILFRVAFYGVWHVFGPYLFPPGSFIWPGPH